MTHENQPRGLFVLASFFCFKEIKAEEGNKERKEEWWWGGDNSELVTDDLSQGAARAAQGDHQAFFPFCMSFVSFFFSFSPVILVLLFFRSFISSFIFYQCLTFSSFYCLSFFCPSFFAFFLFCHAMFLCFFSFRLFFFPLFSPRHDSWRNQVFSLLLGTKSRKKGWWWGDDNSEFFTDGEGVELNGFVRLSVKVGMVRSRVQQTRWRKWTRCSRSVSVRVF